MVALPNKPSALIRVALRDLRLCEEDTGYLINMGRWHTPGYASVGICEVCLAGSVMAQTLDVDRTEHEHPLSFPRATKTRLYALNLLRVGYVEMALDSLDHPRVMEDRHVVTYENDKELFHAQMNRMADDLEEAGV